MESNNSSIYRWSVLGLLALTYAFSFMDRQIVSILLEDLRAEFTLSDAQLGLLSGIAFALFYATLGIPIARLADRHSRVMIITIALTVWSAMTALCGLATNFVQLFLARVGVGIGEAGGNPPSHSLIADYFGPAERSMAISIYSLGTPVGALLGLALGGFIAENYGWRAAFLCAGLPGIALALAIKLAIREPKRGAMDAETPASPLPDHESLVAGARVLLRNVTYRRVNIAHGLAVFVGYGLVSWKPALYLRQFDLSQTEVGAIVGVLGLVGGVPGMILGGYLADRLSLRDPRWPAWICALAIFLAFPTYLAALWIFDWVTASILFGLGVFFYQISHGPGLAIVQSVVEPHRRAQAAAYVFFVSNIFGLGLGPLLVGYVSDVMTPTLDVRSLNASLTLILLALVAAAIMYWRTAIALGERRRGRPETGRASEVSQVPTNPSQSTRSEA